MTTLTTLSTAFSIIFPQRPVLPPGPPTSMHCARARGSQRGCDRDIIHKCRVFPGSLIDAYRLGSDPRLLVGPFVESTFLCSYFVFHFFHFLLPCLFFYLLLSFLSVISYRRLCVLA
ncbi:uncharacterized protein BO80DRAFT_92777 [Aspergillus ibericus CBS 121593]|uniref:Uncharacterized protein n=1 Tax=Aspergillus ibericus CBS 121593 TaxID=1448316 RepID=A0A395GZ38_9EURO|nr:hypothetical protein BO80DRAFT_92777 [Aspergillus ibericus CBS 121593]RAL00593.1 hypothetical protein BO80DRAFT_92777 [Aspergillus ibericus CBS 121593]